jgi:hypothetical protein
MVGLAELIEFDATLVAQEFFDGSKPPGLGDGWQAGDYRVTAPNEIWYVEAGEHYARKESRLSTFVGGVAYALAVSGEVAPDTVTPETVAAVSHELERVACINLHREGEEAGTTEYERVQASQESYRKRQERITSGKEKVFLSIFDHAPTDYRKTSFV